MGKKSEREGGGSPLAHQPAAFLMALSDMTASMADCCTVCLTL